MSHKLQPSTPKNNGLNTVALDTTLRTEPKQPEAKGLEPHVVPQAPRHATCEIMRSRGYDPTGERAEECGATAVIVCEFCGPMCAHCAEEALCFHEEHKPIDSADLQTSAVASAAGPFEPRPLHAVVYIELTCPNCGSIRLALHRDLEPQTHGPLGCPICAALSPAEYLAHGLTQRELPFYEPFDPEPPRFANRIPWDPMPPKAEDDED